MTASDTAAADTAAHVVPALSGELEGLFEDLSGIHPVIDRILDGFRLACTEPLTLEETATVLAALGGDEHYRTDAQALMALVVQRLTDPATNPALRELTPQQAQQVRKQGRLHADYDRDFAPRHHIATAVHETWLNAT